MGGFGSAKGSNSSQSYMIRNIYSLFSLPLFPILIKSPYYSVTLFEKIRLWTKSCSIDYKIQQTFLLICLTFSTDSQQIKSIVFCVYFKWNLGFFVGFFFDPLNALKSIMFVEYFYAQHSPGAVQDGVQIPLVPAGYLAIEWTFWTHTFGLFLSIRHQ